MYCAEKVNIFRTFVYPSKRTKDIILPTSLERQAQCTLWINIDCLLYTCFEMIM